MAATKSSSITFYAILGAVTLLFLYLLTPFFFPLFWAAVIAGIFQPLYRRINSRLKNPNLSTVVVFILIALIILLPMAVVGTLVLNESLQFYAKLSPEKRHLNTDFERVFTRIAAHPYARLFQVDEAALLAKAAEVAQGIANYIFVNLTALTQNTLGLLVKFAIMLYTLFFFLRDGDTFRAAAMRLLPLGKGREKRLLDRFFATARSTLKVTLIIGGIQGILGGIVFLIAGIEGALIWGLLMIIMAVVPVVGCSIIWVPAGIIMLLMGRIWEGVLILAAGVLVISMVDNLLRPVLLGKDVAMHPLMIFLSTLGGIVVFGFSGFVIGPIVGSMLLAIWEMHGEFIGKDAAAD